MSYLDYLKLIQKTFAPALWSCDVYPACDVNGKLWVDYNIFFNSLEGMSEISKTTQRPFWSFCQSMEIKIGNYQRPASTYPILSFEAFSGLAYGSQGIVYWTYGQRFSNSSETYLSALVNLDGKKSPAWYAARKVNLEIKKYNEVFYQCNVKEVKHTGKNLYQGTKRLSGSIGPCRMIRTEDAGVLVSWIENKEKQYIVIVNHDVEKKQKVTIELLPNHNVFDLTLKNRKRYTWRKEINFTLSPGGYKIFQLE